MNFGMLAITTASLMYLVVCICCIKQKDYPHALMWFSYAMANIGLLWYEIKKISGN